MDNWSLFLKLIEQLQQSYKVLNDHSGVMTADIAVLKSQIGEMIFWSRFIVSGVAAIIIERVVNIALTYKHRNDDDNKPPC